MRKDLERLGFPNHIKFIGMTQKRSFLLREEQESITIDEGGAELLRLDPRSSVNWDTYIGHGKTAHYQTFAVKKIYIRITPTLNSFPAGSASIPQLKMTYHNFTSNTLADLETSLSTQSKYKEEYVFAANKSVTFVIKNPKACTGPTVERPRTEMLISYLGKGSAGMTQEDYDGDEDIEEVNSLGFNYGIVRIEGAENTSFNIQVSYKVTVRN